MTQAWTAKDGHVTQVRLLRHNPSHFLEPLGEKLPEVMVG